MSAEAKTRVLVVDDSAIVRKVISDILSLEADIEVVGTAPDPYVARDKILALRPDVLTLDIEMPRMDGLTFLDRIMRFHPLPVIVISSLTQSSTRAALEAMTRGAVDVLAKPGGPYSVGDLKLDLPRRIRAAARARPRQPQASPPATAPVSAAPAAPPSCANHVIASRLIAIGASTGGTQAIEQILTRLPRNMPPIVVTQHIPAGFSAAFAERLNRVCSLDVEEARGGEVLRPGLVLIAPGNYHLLVERISGGGWCTRLDEGPKVCYQRPSVDMMFQSVSTAAAASTLAVLLTGMGSDGAEGMATLRHAGAATIAQNEATCVVFGMPREAIRLGAAQQVLPLNEIAQALTRPSRA